MASLILRSFVTPLLLATSLLACDRPGPPPAADTGRGAAPAPSPTAAPPPAVDPGAAAPPAAAPPPPVAAAALRPLKKQLRFGRGETGTVVDGTVASGQSHVYEIGATAGQQMTVSITSPGSSAAFRLYVVSPYGWQDRLNAQGNVAFVDVQWSPGAGKPQGVDTDRTSWSGPLPEASKSGPGSIYAIEVVPTRGSAAYSLKVDIAAGAPRAGATCTDAGFCSVGASLGLCRAGTCKTCRPGFNLLHESTRCHPVLDCAAHTGVDAVKTAQCDQCMSGACLTAPGAYEPNF